MNLEHDTARSISPGVVAAGAVLLVLGVGMLLTPAEHLRLEPGRLIGPFIMIMIGTTVLLSGRGCAHRRAVDEAAALRRRASRRQRSTSGLWLIGVGCWLLVSQTGLFGLGFGTSWPLLLIVMGLLLAIRGWR